MALRFEPCLLAHGEFELRLEAAEQVGTIDLVELLGIVDQQAQVLKGDVRHGAFLLVAFMAAGGEVVEPEAAALLANGQAVIEFEDLEGEGAIAVFATAGAGFGNEELKQEIAEFLEVERQGAKALFHGVKALAGDCEEFAVGLGIGEIEEVGVLVRSHGGSGAVERFDP